MSDHEYCLLGLIKFIYKIPKYANKNSAMDTTHTVIMSPIHSNISDGPAKRCEESDCLTTLRSKAACKRHYSILHNKNAPEDNERVYVCNYEGCNKGFTSSYYLNQHRRNKGHRNENERRGRKKKQTFVDSDNSEQSDNETSTQNNGGVRSRSTRKKPVALSVAKSRRSKRSRN